MGSKNAVSRKTQQVYLRARHPREAKPAEAGIKGNWIEGADQAAAREYQLARACSGGRVIIARSGSVPVRA